MQFFKKSQFGKGFSLIELSVIISVAAAAAVGFLAWTQPANITDAGKAIETSKKIEKIAEAMETFRVEQGRLPCPADPYMRSDNTRNTAGGTDYYINDYGEEDLDNLNTTINGKTTYGVDCPNTQGAVPVHALGLGNEYMEDAWNRRFTYQISNTLCTSDAGTESGISTTLSEKVGCTKFDYVDGVGSIKVTSSGGATTLTDKAAYVIVSHGARGDGAFLPGGTKLANSANADELENSDSDTTFVKTSYSSTYDDIVYFKTKVQIERLTDASNVEQFTVDECEANSQALKDIDAAEVAAMTNHIDSYQHGTVNNGEQVALGLLRTIQTICVEYYGWRDKAPDGIDGKTWSGGQCPGNNNPGINGTTYYYPGDKCTCKDGDWDGNCTMDWDAVMPVTDEVIWLDSNDISSLFQDDTCTTAVSSNGQSVGCWKDKSGNNLKATQTTGTAKPTYNTNVLNTNMPVLTYDGGDQLDMTVTATVNNNYSVFFVTSVANTNTISRFFNTRNGGNTFDAKFSNGTLIHGDIGTGSAWLDTSADISYNYTINTPYIIEYIVTQTGYSAYINGGNQTIESWASNTPELYAAADVINFGTTVEAFNGRIAEAIIYNRAVTSTERSNIERYLGLKWGVTVP